MSYVLGAAVTEVTFSDDEVPIITASPAPLVRVEETTKPLAQFVMPGLLALAVWAALR